MSGQGRAMSLGISQSQNSAVRPHRSVVGARIHALRKQHGITLMQMASACGLSEATLSRIENGQSSVSAENLFVMAQILDVDITHFFASDASPPKKGMRSITRRNDAEIHDLSRFASHLLNSDISAKQMLPAINYVSARDLLHAGGLQAHAGEEFLLVLSGRLVLHTELYSPTLLEKGDSCYFDGSIAHAYLNGGKADFVEILVVVQTVALGSQKGEAGYVS